MNRPLMMARIAKAMADDDRFGYSQKPPSGRWGPDFDCSSFIYFVAWLSGYSVGIGPGKVRFTGQMTKDFKDAGFELLPFANVGLGDLDIGDILLNLALHAEIYVGDGQVVGAQSSETGGYVGKAGDQTGTEIVKQPAYVYENDWDFVLRPPENAAKDDEEAEKAEEGDEQEMPYPYGNTTMGGGNWMPNTGIPNMPRTTMPNGNWMPPMQNYGYPQGNVGQLNGYASTTANGYQQPGQMGYGGQTSMNYPQGNNPNVRVFEMTECTETMNMQQGGMMGIGGMNAQQQPRMQQSQGAVSREEFDQLKEMIANVQSAVSGYPQGNGVPMDTQGNGSDAQSGRNGNSSSQQSGNRSGRNS